MNLERTTACYKPMPSSDSTSRRAWRGQSGKKPNTRHHLRGKRPVADDTAKTDRTSTPESVQRRVLGIFKDAFRPRVDSDLPTLIQEVKGHLYVRDFGQAFAKEAYQEAYAIRWSVSRALAYLTIFDDVREHLLPRGLDASTEACVSSSGPAIGGHRIASLGREPGSAARMMMSRHPPLTVTCLGGGGGAEVVALAALLGLVHEPRHADEHGDVVEPFLFVDIVDRADWTHVIQRLKDSITKARCGLISLPVPSRAALDPRTLENESKITFHQRDLLDMAPDELRPLVMKSEMITLMFTLNELYTTSKLKTTNFLLRLGLLVKKDALFLVVDSPGSYSAVQLGPKEEDAVPPRSYPMRWLLDHTLISLARDEHDQPRWTKVTTDESRWFRLPDHLQYPIDLENTRYQMHLFRRN